MRRGTKSKKERRDQAKWEEAERIKMLEDKNRPPWWERDVKPHIKKGGE